jgi:hypothetical protein
VPFSALEIRRASGLARQHFGGPDPFRLPFPIGCHAQRIHLFRLQLARLAGLQVQHQGTVAHTPDLFYVVPDLLEHLAQFAVAPFNQSHLKPGILPMADLADARRSSVHSALAGLAPVDPYSPAQRLDLGLAGLAGDLHQVDLLHTRGGARELVGQLAVIGHQQQAFAQIIEPPHRVEPFAHAGEELHHRRPALRILDCGHVAARLVQHKVPLALGAMEQLAVHADVIARGIGLAAKSRDYLPIYLHPAFSDEFLGMAAAGYARGGQDLLQPLQLGRRTLGLFLFVAVVSASRLPVPFEFIGLIGLLLGFIGRRFFLLSAPGFTLDDGLGYGLYCCGCRGTFVRIIGLERVFEGVRGMRRHFGFSRLRRNCMFRDGRVKGFDLDLRRRFGRGFAGALLYRRLCRCLAARLGNIISRLYGKWLLGCRFCSRAFGCRSLTLGGLFLLGHGNLPRFLPGKTSLRLAQLLLIG